MSPNTPDVLTNDVADLGVAMMLCLSRGMVGAEAWVRSGDWAAKGLYPLKRQVWEDMLQVLERLGHPISERQKNYFLPK